MSEENEVPSDEQVARSIIYKDDFFRQYSEIVPEVGEHLERYVFDIRDALSTLRASWEKEKYDLLTYGANQAETIVRLEEEKKGLEEAVKEQEYFIGSLHNYDGDAKRLLEETVAENRRLKAKLQMTDDAYVALKMDHDRLKVENADLKGQHKGLVEINKMLRQRPDLPVERIPVYEEMKSEIDTLTCALAEAREALDWFVNEAERAISKGYDITEILIERCLANGKKALSNQTSQRASEEMKGLRKRIELMGEVVTYANTVRNDILIPETDEQVEMSCQCKEWVDGLLERLKALEAYESRGKV